MNQTQESGGRKVWRIIYPVLVYLGVSIVAGLIIGVVLSARYVASSGTEIDLEKMTETLVKLINERALLITLICDGLTIPFMLLFMWQDKKRDILCCRYKKYETPAAMALLGCVILGVGLCVTENNLLDISGLNQTFSEDSEMIAELLYQGGIWFELLVVGLVGPVMEELLFRGVIQKRLADYVKPGLAAVLSALIFGAFHGNMLQFIYAFIFGLGFAFVYSKFHTVWAPILAHCAGNITSVLLTETPLLEGIEEWSMGHILFIVIGALLALAGFAMVYYTREPNLLTSPSAEGPQDYSTL